MTSIFIKDKRGWWNSGRQLDIFRKENVYVWLCACMLSDVFATPWTIAHQAPLFMGFPRQEFLLQGIFSTQGSNPHLLYLLYLGRHSTTEPPGKPVCLYKYFLSRKLVRNKLQGLSMRPKSGMTCPRSFGKSVSLLKLEPTTLTHLEALL